MSLPHTCPVRRALLSRRNDERSSVSSVRNVGNRKAPWKLDVVASGEKISKRETISMEQQYPNGINTSYMLFLQSVWNSDEGEGGCLKTTEIHGHNGMPVFDILPAVATHVSVILRERVPCISAALLGEI
ncbi:hypothetical protein KM043_006479 [Ampulex compressa]|nr:hypothetical protein KM043_006479 [Ampulex compressa]